MPDTGWGSYAICNVADIRDRWLTPETLLAVNSAPDTPFSVTVSTNAFTSEIPHGFTDWTAVRFVGDALPAPLDDATTYYVRQTTESTFRLATAIGGAAINVADGTATVFNNGLNDMLEKKRTLGKEWLYDALQAMVVQHVSSVGAISWNWQNDFQLDGNPINPITPLQKSIVVLNNLANPERLKHVLIDFTGWAMATDGRFRNQITDSFAMDSKRDAVKDMEKAAKQRLIDTAPLLYVTTSNDTRGLFSFDQSQGSISVGLF